MILILFCIISCGEKKTEFEDVKTPRDHQPRLSADSVTTLISDSGITRYRITTTKWLIFDKTAKPYWFFPNGIRFEKFDTSYKTDALMRSNKAIYYEQEKLWRFNGDVSAKNLKGERFETQELFWNNAKEKFYSDKEIKIYQTDKVIIGVGFESNSAMTQYTIRKPTGSFPLEEK